MIAILLIFCIVASSPTIRSQSVETLSIESGKEKPLVGTNVTLFCNGSGKELQWLHRKRPIVDNAKEKIETASTDEIGIIETRLHLYNISWKETGKYRCIAKEVEKKDVEKSISLHVQGPPELEETTNFTAQIGSKATLSCTSRAAPIPSVKWIQNGVLLSQDKRYVINNKTEGNLHISKLSIENVGESDNGTYTCYIQNSHGESNGSALLFVMDVPVIELLIARSLGPEKIQLNWKVEDNNGEINSTNIYVVKDAVEIIIPVTPPTTTSIILDKESLQLSGQEEAADAVDIIYSIVIKVTNPVGSAKTSTFNVTMLKKKPHFVPEASLRGSTKDSLSVSWTLPDEQLKEYIDLYRLSLINVETQLGVSTIKYPNASDNLFTNLDHGTMYKFTVTACMKFQDAKEECSTPSIPVSGKTLSEPPESVSDIFVKCLSNRTSGENSVFVRWVPPEDEKTVERYKIELKASANFVNEDGRNDYYNHLTHEIVSAEVRNYTFINVDANTNYTVKVYTGNKNLFSSSLVANCETPFWLPKIRQFRWWKSKVDQKTVLKLLTPHVSQRNGTICCHRVIVVRLGENKTLSDLPEPKDIPILSYYSVHDFPQIGGYVAEAFGSRGVTSKYLLVGDGEVSGNWSLECAKCLGLEQVYASATRERVGDATNKELPHEDEIKRNATFPYTQMLRKRSLNIPSIAEDGELSKEENYTGYLIMTVRDKNGTVLSAYSDFFNIIQPIEDPIHVTTTTPSSLSSSLTHVVYILGSLIVILALMAICLGFLLCHYHKKKQLLDDGIDESLSGSLGRRFFRTLRRSHTLMSQPGIDVKPIPKEDLVSEYLEKIKDSELGFRREFEALPEKCSDRSSRSSEMPENSCKNRYPDIKAYDQTRVKICQINGLVGSDYINANYVMGYKERKKFICAQGPMDSTVNDFWRMVVEQRSSLVIMLTNLEEQGKVKCVKYWPEAGEPKTFGNITVRLVKEKPYADYLVRTLRAEWTVSTTTNSNTTTATENGVITSGTATTKSNSSVSNSNGNSNYNSLSSNSATVTEETKFHEILQYHYLVWKDFVAPEHPVGLLSFLRRINEAYSPDMGPLLVHCSAGVGRTGTLVALDTLVTELDEEGQASIFNIICDLRHQRNFLVQSLKQYIFVHRALMEHAQFGNTEQSMSKLKEAYNKHTQHNNQEDQSDLVKEFDRLSKVIEDRKAFTVANSESNRAKNRYENVLPYDTNCVILTPLPSQIQATYINASFVTGFDLGESFIITQDPLENTISDFWRMIYEQEVNTIVMLSELGSGEISCSKYWPDEEEIHEYITVKFVASESYPKYSTRTFLVTNNKNSDSISVTQFQYVGWSGLMGEVPLVTYGIMEIITRVQSHNDTNRPMSSISPTVVHCSGGGDRSSVYVCLNNCLRQLRREECVDVFQTARKIRAQRQYQLQAFAQYEFVYKALVEYIDLKRGENL